MDTLAAKAITKNLNGILVGKEILGLITVARDIFALVLRGLPGGVVLRMAYPAAVYYDSSRLKQSRDFPPLSDASILEGATLKKVEQYGDDRIVRLMMDIGGESSTLIFELFRRPPSIYLTSNAGEAITIYGRRIDGDYVYPPDMMGDNKAFGEVSIEEIADIISGGDVAGTLRKRITHLSPRVSEYLAGKSAEDIYDVSRKTDEAFGNGSGVAQLVKSRWMAYPAPIFGEYETKTFDDINDAVRFAALETSRLRRLEMVKAGIGRSLRSRRKKLEKQRIILSAELAGFEEPEKIRDMGDLLKSNFHLIKRGIKAIKVNDYSRGGEVEIELDPALSPEANMQTYYKRYRKALTGKEKVEKRLDYIEPELAKIEGILQTLEDATDAKDIEHLLPEEKGGTAVKGGKIVGRRYVSSDGFEVVVGRGAKENDAVTFGVGRPGDLWLHVREAQGSHVIVRRKEKGKPFPKRTINEAAAIAAYFSKSRNAEIVPVIVTERRYVAKVKGSPGLVRVMREEVIFVEPGEVLKPGKPKN